MFKTFGTSSRFLSKYANYKDLVRNQSKPYHFWTIFSNVSSMMNFFFLSNITRFYYSRLIGLFIKNKTGPSHRFIVKWRVFITTVKISAIPISFFAIELVRFFDQRTRSTPCKCFVWAVRSGIFYYVYIHTISKLPRCIETDVMPSTFATIHAILFMLPLER